MTMPCPLFAEPKLVLHGLDSLMIYLADEPSPQVLLMQQQLLAELKQAFGPALLELVPSYISLFIWFDPMVLEHTQVSQHVRQCWLACYQAAQQHTVAGRRVVLPCYYADETGADLSTLAQRKGLSISKLIDLHSRQPYQVYAIGFAPGFAYLGFVDASLAAPRHPTPRALVPAGTVALADRQTAVYPAASPGGWQLLGRCPLSLFSLTTEPPMPFAVGDEVQFMPIERNEYLRLGGEL